MPYIKRDDSGALIGVQEQKTDDYSVWIELADDELIEFLKSGAAAPKVIETLINSDNDMARVTDDLIELLMEKQLFAFTELPIAVQKKLNARRQLREVINPLEKLVDDGENIF